METIRDVGIRREFSDRMLKELEGRTSMTNKELIEKLNEVHNNTIVVNAVKMFKGNPNVILVERMTNIHEVEVQKNLQRDNAINHFIRIVSSLYMRRMPVGNVDPSFFERDHKVVGRLDSKLQIEYFDMLNELLPDSSTDVVDFKVTDGNSSLYYILANERPGRKVCINLIFDAKNKVVSFYTYNIARNNDTYQTFNNMLVGPIFFSKKERDAENYIKSTDMLSNAGYLNDDMIHMFIEGIDLLGDMCDHVEFDENNITPLAHCDYSYLEMYTFRKMLEACVSDKSILSNNALDEAKMRTIFHTLIKVKNELSEISPEQLDFIISNGFTFHNISSPKDLYSSPIVKFSKKDLKWISNWLKTDKGLDIESFYEDEDGKLPSIDIRHILASEEIEPFRTVIFEESDGINEKEVKLLRENQEDTFTEGTELRNCDNLFMLRESVDRKIIVSSKYNFKDDVLKIIFIVELDNDIYAFKTLSLINMKELKPNLDNLYSIENGIYVWGSFYNIPVNDDEFDKLMPAFFPYKTITFNFIWEYLSILMLQYEKPERQKVVREMKPVEERSNVNRGNKNNKTQEYVIRRLLMTTPAARKYIKDKEEELGKEVAERMYTIEEWNRRGHWRYYHKGEANEKKVWIEEVKCHRHKSITKREVRIKL